MIPQNKTLRCSVFQIRAPVPANSYILLPKNSNQSLGLTGRYLYLLFRPIPGKYFVVHLDVSSKVSGWQHWYDLKDFFLRRRKWRHFLFPLSVCCNLKESQVIRISFSNMFKEFKSTSTWLQFPFLCGAAADSVYESTAKSAKRGKMGKNKLHTHATIHIYTWRFVIIHLFW